MGLFSGKCLSSNRLDGVTAIITGSNTGIGKETAKDFFTRGARVILACRNEDSTRQAIEDIKNQCKDQSNLGELHPVKLDLMSLTSIRLCAQNILAKEERINLLVNNAGVMMCPQGKTEDGFETQFGTNHLGHFLLTMLLLPRICQSAPARIVNVSSRAQEQGVMDFNDLNFERTREYGPLAAYQQSKLANVLFSKELARRLQESNITGVNVYSLHPGVVATELGRHLKDTVFVGFVWAWQYLFKPFAKTPLEGAQTTIYCAVDDQCANETGLYYSDCKPKAVGRNASNSEDAQRLWNESLKLVGLDPNYNPFK